MHRARVRGFLLRQLHGYNRHTMWPDSGSALTLEEVQTDVSLLQQLNANYVRGAHYAQVCTGRERAHYFHVVTTLVVGCGCGSPVCLPVFPCVVLLAVLSWRCWFLFVYIRWWWWWVVRVCAPCGRMCIARA
jgi:hypothetical protein